MNGVHVFRLVAGVAVMGTVAGVFFGGPIALLFLGLRRVERRVRSAEPRLAGLPCPHCGVAIGAEAAAAAQEAHAETVRKLREMTGDAMVRLRIDPLWRFPCPACGAALTFDPGTRKNALIAA